MSRDYLIAIMLTVAGVAAGIVLMVAPTYLHLSPKSIFYTFWVGTALTVIFILTAAGMALRAGNEKPKEGSSVSGKNKSSLTVSSNNFSVSPIGARLR